MRVRLGLSADYRSWWDFAFPKVIGGMVIGGAIIFGMATPGIWGLLISLVAVVAAVVLVAWDYVVDRRRGYIQALADHRSVRLKRKERDA